MATIEWEWRQTANLPFRALVVASRTEYDDEGWDEIRSMLVPASYRLLGDPNILGIAAKLDEKERVVWGMSAWPNYDALELCVRTQIEWLTHATDKLQHNILLRHNAYRVLSVDQLPLSWTHVEYLVEKVRSVSPLGADAFPELTKMLGMDEVPQ